MNNALQSPSFSVLCRAYQWQLCRTRGYEYATRNGAGLHSLARDTGSTAEDTTVSNHAWYDMACMQNQGRLDAEEEDQGHSHQYRW